MSPEADVLAQYPPPSHGPITALGNHGGFSGASLFRVDAPAGPLCLRAWPAGIHSAWLDQIHSWMHAAALYVDFVPQLFPTARGELYVRAAGRFWELTTWMPGTPAAPTPQRIANACLALAQIHRAWAEALPRRGICPAITRRWTVYQHWLPLIRSDWAPPNDPLDPVAPHAQKAWPLLRRRLAELPRQLCPWMARPVPLQACLCDVWSAHVLFTGDRVTGLVDFGSCKIDHVAVDLARLLGSMVGGDPVHWRSGLNAYAQVNPLSPEARELARDLDRSGVVVAAANWLRWLYREGRVYPDRTAVAQRLAALVERLQELLTPW